MTYEAHKEYLAKMYEEYQRQEEENMKKGKKGSVSTISGLSAQPASVNGALEARETDDTSQTHTPESEAEYTESSEQNLLTDSKEQVHVHELLVDIKAEKVEATEVKLDDLDLSPEALGGGGGGGGGGMENGPLVEVDSLLDAAYCVHKLNGGLTPKEEEEPVIGTATNDNDSNLGPLITLDDEKDIAPSNNGFLFPKSEEKLLPSLATPEPLPLSNPEQMPAATAVPTSVPVSSVSDDLSLLAHMTSCDSDLAPDDDSFKLQSSLADISTLAEGRESGIGESGTVKSGDAISTVSDTERSDDGKDKEMKKIQTTATTQVQTCLAYKIRFLYLHTVKKIYIYIYININSIIIIYKFS